MAKEMEEQEEDEQKCHFTRVPARTLMRRRGA
jgi:hypothetical protein